MKLVLYIVGVLLATVLIGPEFAGEIVGVSIVLYLVYKLTGLLSVDRA